MNTSTGRPARDDRNTTAPPWVVLITFGAIAAVLGYLWVWGRRYGLDLRVYRQSVEVWHRGENPYLALFTGSHLAYTYPPFSLVVFTPLRWVSLAASQWAMWAISIAAAIVSIWTVLR